MAKFIVLTEAGPMHRRVVINVASIEYMLERPNGTEVVTSTNRTKYVVQESLDDIVKNLFYYGLVVRDHSKQKIESAEETPSTTEVENNENSI